MAYELLSQSRKLNERGIPNKSGGWKIFSKKKKQAGGGALIRAPRVILNVYYIF